MRREDEQFKQDLRMPYRVEVECGPLALRDFVSREELVAPDDRCRRQRLLFLTVSFDWDLLSVLQLSLGLVPLSVLRLVLRFMLVVLVLTLVLGVHTMSCVPFVLGVLHFPGGFFVAIFFKDFFWVVGTVLSACGGAHYIVVTGLWSWRAGGGAASGVSTVVEI